MASDIHIFMHILLPMMIRIFSWVYFSGGLANSTVTIFGTGMRHIRGVRSTDVSGQTSANWCTFLWVKQTSNPYRWTFCANVGMEWKVLGTEREGFVPNSSFHISLSTLQQTEVKMLTKSFGPLQDDRSLVDSDVYMKSRGF